MKNQRSDTSKRRRRDVAPIIGLEHAPEKRHLHKKSHRESQTAATSALLAVKDVRRDSCPCLN